MRIRLAALGLTGAMLALQGLAAPPALAVPVVGYIKITMNVGMTEPQVIVSGVLANPLQWSCVRPLTYNPLLPYTVKCTPVAPQPPQPWSCSVLHANSNTFSAAAQLRTSMFCDAGTVPAAQTNLVSGVGGFHYRYGPANSVVAEFRCTVDNGGTAAAVPNYAAFCGDPPSLDLL